MHIKSAAADHVGAICFRKDDAARVNHLLNDLGGLFRPVAAKGAVAAGRFVACDIDLVFHRERQASQRAKLAFAGAGLVDRTCAF